MTHKINDRQACTNKNKVCEMHLYIIFYNNKCNFSFHHHEPSDQHARQESNKKTSWVRKGFSTTDHLHIISQLIERSKEYKIPLVVGDLN